jgi:hypothetical protein
VFSVKLHPKNTNLFAKAINSKVLFLILTSALLAAFAVAISQRSGKTAENDANIYISQKMLDCNNAQYVHKCLKENAADFIEKYPLPQILEVFKNNETKQEFFTNCHLTAHFLGQAAYKKMGSVGKVFSQSTYACLGGVFHGAVEGYFIEKNIDVGGGNYDAVSAEIPKICGKSEDYQRPQDFTECNHGMGHALMFLTENDVLEALKLCDYLPNDNQQNLCYTGAFMQNADGAQDSDHPSKYFSASDPLYVCDLVEEKYKRQCYTYATLTETQFDVQKSAQLCREIPKNYQLECFNTVGRDRTMTTAEPSELKRQCYEIPEADFQKECIRGASYNLVVRFNYDSPVPLQFCAILEGDQKLECFSQTGLAIKNITASDEILNSFCSQISEESYKNKCLGKN